MWARTLWPLSSCTLNMAFGSDSTTVPSISMAPSFLAKIPRVSLIDRLRLRFTSSRDLHASERATTDKGRRHVIVIVSRLRSVRHHGANRETRAGCPDTTRAQSTGILGRPVPPAARAAPAWTKARREPAGLREVSQ